MPETTQRNVGGHYLDLATSLVRFDQSEPDQPSDTVIRELTPTEILDLVFPEVVPETPYSHFLSTEKPDQAVWFVHPDANSPQLQQQVLREAALGMMDNPYFR